MSSSFLQDAVVFEVWKQLAMQYILRAKAISLRRQELARFVPGLFIIILSFFFDRVLTKI
jgi:hypothetical protein